MNRTSVLLPFLLACADAEPCPASACDEIQARKLAVLTACGVPASAAAIDCTDANVSRLDCQVFCMEAAPCDALDGSDAGYLIVGNSYHDCLDACPGVARP